MQWFRSRMCYSCTEKAKIPQPKINPCAGEIVRMAKIMTCGVHGIICKNL